MGNKNFIKEALVSVVEDLNADESTIARYFSKDYIQHVDGKTLSYSDFISHMKVQKSALKSVKITFKHMLEEGNQVATVHVAQGIKKNETRFETQVNAFFQIKEGKIISCDELTNLISGTPSDRDLGSRK